MSGKVTKKTKKKKKRCGNSDLKFVRIGDKTVKHSTSHLKEYLLGNGIACECSIRNATRKCKRS
jgi:hypothetical protein